MADGIYPGPKGLRERILRMWERSAAPAVPLAPEPATSRRESPAPALNPPGMGPARRMVWPQPANDLRPAPQIEKPSYIEDLKARIRGEQREGRSLLGRDFDRER